MVNIFNKKLTQQVFFLFSIFFRICMSLKNRESNQAKIILGFIKIGLKAI